MWLKLFTGCSLVGLVDSKPSTNLLHLFVKKREVTWHLTRKRWNVTCNMWHVTHDTWQVKEVNFLSKLQHHSFNSLEDWEGKDHVSNNVSISIKGVYRTAPATPGLLITLKFIAVLPTGVWGKYLNLQFRLVL